MKKLTLQILYSGIARVFLRMIAGVSFSDNSFLKKEKQFIIVANHNSHIDTVAILASLPPSIIHKVKPIASKEYFGKCSTRAKLTEFFVNALLINTDKRSRSRINPIEQMLKSLDQGNSLIIFPEGTRGKPGEMEELKKGIALLLMERPHIKYVPVFMEGMDKTMPKGDGLLVPHNSSITFGQPRLKTSSNLTNILNQVKENIIQLNYQS
jgi:1-acyl-sn-glycerol-3-phosphate acyltransferase